jgi:hypothetical protein
MPAATQTLPNATRIASNRFRTTNFRVDFGFSESF